MYNDGVHPGRNGTQSFDVPLLIAV